MTTIELWKLIKLSFVRPRSITYDRFFSFQEIRNEQTVEHYYSILNESVEKSKFADNEETVTQDVLKTYGLDTETHQKLLRLI